MSESSGIIPVSEIDLSDEQYKISDPCTDIARLSMSIKEIGLTHPVIVRSMHDKPVLIAGFNRVKACLHAGIDNIQVRRIKQRTSQNITELHCLKLSITDNAFQRDLSTSEIVRSILKLNLYMNLEQISEKSISLFNIHLNLKIIKDFCAIANLPPMVYPLLKESRLAIKPAVLLAGMPLENAKALLTLFSVIKVSSSKQLDILLLFHEIAAREKTDLITILSCEDLKRILEQDNPDQGVKGNLIRSYLKQRRYPNILAAEKKFNDHIKKLSLKNEIIITPPKDFEGTSFEATFKFDTVSEYSHRVDLLKALGRNPLFIDLIPCK